MTWTATERDHVIGPGRVAEISDGDKVFCCIYSTSTDPAAVEQIRARARLIVQAEAMRDALEYWVSVAQNDPAYSAWLGKARAIIKATGGEDG